MTEKQAYKRKCENWLETFVHWARPRCESPDNYIVWSGIFTLAAALRRHVVIPREKLGGWEVSPNMYIVFVAPPGKARKSTTIGFSEDLLDSIQRITKAPTIVTQAALLKRLVDSDDASVYIQSSEFSSLIKKSGVEMFEFLTDVFDGRKNIEASTIMRGIEFAERPCINLFAATTPRWITENMPESVIGGGFASRVIFIYEDTVRHRQLYYENLDFKVLDELRARLVDDLQHIADNIHGNFDIESDAKDYMETWYRKNAEVKGADYRLAGYLERRPAHIHKLAIILHVARSDTLTIELEDFKKAIFLLSLIEKRLPEIFKAIGKNVHAPEMGQIAEYVLEKKKVSRTELLNQFYSAAHPNLLEELIQGLLVMEQIHTIQSGLHIWYLPGPKPKEESIA